MVRESDSEDEAELDAYSDFDALDGGEVEVSPEDEQALAAFMVRAESDCQQSALSTQRCLSTYSISPPKHLQQKLVNRCIYWPSLLQRGWYSQLVHAMSSVSCSSAQAVSS